MDNEAGNVVHRLRGRGYQPVEVLEQDYVERLSGVRPERGSSDVIMDLPFASSGIENEVFMCATRIQVLPRASSGSNLLLSVSSVSGRGVLRAPAPSAAHFPSLRYPQTGANRARNRL